MNKIRNTGILLLLHSFLIWLWFYFANTGYSDMYKNLVIFVYFILISCFFYQQETLKENIAFSIFNGALAGLLTNYITVTFYPGAFHDVEINYLLYFKSSLLFLIIFFLFGLFVFAFKTVYKKFVIPET